MRERHEILYLRGVVLHIRHVCQRIVAHRVIAGVSSGVPDAGKILGVGFPGFPGSEQLAHDIVVGNGKRLRRHSVDEREGLSRGEHEIVRDGRMCVREIV